MTRRMILVSGGAAAAAVLLIAAMVIHHRMTAPEPPVRSAFAQQVDLAPLGRVAVYEEGRLKSFDSFASSMMNFVSGPHQINGNPDGFSYLDLMLRPEAYRDKDVLYVKSKPLRRDIIEALRRSLDEVLADQAHAGRELQSMFDERFEGFRDTGLISEEMLLEPRVQELLEIQARDLIRTSRAVDQVRSAMSVKHPEVLAGSLRIVPPAGESGAAFEQPWTAPDAFSTSSQASATEWGRRLSTGWSRLTSAWRAGDAAAVNAAAAELAAVLPAANPDLYPNQDRLAWESWYFGAGNMTWVWLIYLLSVILLVMSVAYRWPAARHLGLAAFAIAFGFHTFAIALRWYVSGRWPNANMFEAVTTSAWLGGCLALVLEVVVRRNPMHGLFALGSAVASMVALMCAHFLPVELNANIANKMPVLHDVWLYIHTNVIIFSYCLISMAAVSALIYVIYRLGGGRADYVRVGGAGALILTKPTGESYLSEARTSAGQVLDGATMVLMEIAFIMLWAGLVMGAIWADHSWGRPWGWDPKEVFALNTFIILALLIHVRLKVRDKGLWTALLALAGFGVMLFNWIVINFVIVGLHSYA